MVWQMLRVFAEAVCVGEVKRKARRRVSSDYVWKWLSSGHECPPILCRQDWAKYNWKDLILPSCLLPGNICGQQSKHTELKQANTPEMAEQNRLGVKSTLRFPFSARRDLLWIYNKNCRFVSHQQQVLSRDPDRVGEGVIILILYKLLRVSRPHFDLQKERGQKPSGPTPVNHHNYTRCLYSSDGSTNSCV